MWNSVWSARETSYGETPVGNEGVRFGGEFGFQEVDFGSFL